jgi:hypothetical protein
MASKQEAGVPSRRISVILNCTTSIIIIINHTTLDPFLKDTVIHSLPTEVPGTVSTNAILTPSNTVVTFFATRVACKIGPMSEKL